MLAAAAKLMPDWGGQGLTCWTGVCTLQMAAVRAGPDDVEGGFVPGVAVAT